VKELWAELNGDSTGDVKMEAIDMEADCAMKSLRDFLLSKYDCILDAWHGCLDDDGNVWLDEAELCYKLSVAGYDAGGPRQWQQLFQFLLPGKASRHIHVDDLQAVLIGVGNTQRKLLWEGPKKPPPPVGHHDPVENARRALEVLKNVLVRKFGSVYTGWWRGIDVARAGSVPMTDFVQAMNAIGYPGNMKHLLKSLNKENKEPVTLRDIDAETATAVETFASLAIAACGSFSEAWSTRLDVDNAGYVEELVFCKFCSDIQYPNSSKALFKIFNPSPGRWYLFFEDFGHLALAPGPGRSPSRHREPEARWRKDLSKRKDAHSPTQTTLKQKQSPSPEISPPEKNRSPTAWESTTAGSESIAASAASGSASVADTPARSQRSAVQFELPSAEPETPPAKEPVKPGVGQPAKQPATLAEEPAIFSTDVTVAPDGSAANLHVEEAAVAAEQEQLVSNDP